MTLRNLVTILSSFSYVRITQYVGNDIRTVTEPWIDIIEKYSLDVNVISISPRDSKTIEIIVQ